MLVFGHAGITLALGTLAVNLTERIRHKTLKNIIKKSSLTEGNRFSGKYSGSKTSWLSYIGSRIDVRFLLLGSLLPDIIDKPVGLYFFREIFSNGRIFCHTLLFLVVITAVGILFDKRFGKTWGIAISIGSFAHLILDQMWRQPKTLFWPLFGLTFDRMDTGNWLRNIFIDLLTKPVVYIPEIIGMIILIVFTCELLRRRRMITFMKCGQVQ